MNDENTETNGILHLFAKSLFSGELRDVSTDIAEIALDSLFEGDTILREIPLVKTAIAMLKTGGSIQARFEFKKQLVFLSHLQRGDLDTKGMSRRNKAYQNKEPWFEREVENIVVYLSRYSTVEKARIQAEFYIDLINGVIDQPFFEECLDILDRIFLGDIKHLIDIYDIETAAGVTLSNLSFFQQKPSFEFDSIRCGRLSSVGLLHQLHPMSFGFSIDNYYLISDSGKYICQKLLKLYGRNADESRLYRNI